MTIPGVSYPASPPIQGTATATPTPKTTTASTITILLTVTMSMRLRRSGWPEPPSFRRLATSWANSSGERRLAPFPDGPGLTLIDEDLV